MAKGDYDAVLGNKVHTHLSKLGIESPIDFERRDKYEGAGQAHIEEAMQAILMCIGMDLKDDSICKTPHRVSKMYMKEIFYGMDYRNFPRAMAINNKMKADEMICMRKVVVRSVCEHHLVPFVGHATIAYLPCKKVSGLSKINRIVDFFCRRPQVQERLTEQVAATLSLILETDSVAVVIDAAHFCIKLRGVEDPDSTTVTSKLLGKFRSNAELRNEFLSLSK